jgi:hypothetical protein
MNNLMKREMNSQEIQQSVYEWALSKNFTAPYGVIEGEHINRKGKKYKAVAFGYARTLDATVEIYNRNFIVVRTSRHDSQVFKDYTSMMQFLETL